MHAIGRIVLVIVVSFLCMSRMCAAATSSASSSVVIQISPDSSFLDLNSTDRTATRREASTPIHIVVTSATTNFLLPIDVYACVDTDEAMRLVGKSLALTTANVRIRNEQGEWAALEPLAELEGRRGVRIATINSASARIILHVQLYVQTSQTQGTYQGTLMLLARER
jgi:hypothetical protein